MPAASWAAPAVTAAPNPPCEFGVRVKVYVVPEPLKFDTAAFVGVTSVAVNPVTASPNVAVTTTGPFTVGGAAEERASVGGVPSNVRVKALLAALPLPAASWAAPAATAAPNGPSTEGVRVNV